MSTVRTANRLIIDLNPSYAEAMVENIPLNGTMETGSHITFEMDNVKDLRYYIIGIKLDR